MFINLKQLEKCGINGNSIMILNIIKQNSNGAQEAFLKSLNVDWESVKDYVDFVKKGPTNEAKARLNKKGKDLLIKLVTSSVDEDTERIAEWVKKVYKKRNMRTKWTLEKFIDESNKIHDNKYDYSKITNFKNLSSTCTIICKLHGEFEQNLYLHKNGSGCRKCAIESRNKKITTPLHEYIIECNRVHNNKYDYSLLRYQNNKSKGTIICPVHGNFEQEVSSHSKGYGCPKCSREDKEKSYKNGFVKFLNKSKKIHGDKYDYSKVVFRGGGVDVEIVCKTHGLFKQKPENHLKGRGCIICYNVRNLQKSGNTHSWLYLIEFKDYLKIGISSNISKRISTLKSLHGEIQDVHKFYGTNDSVCMKEGEIKNKYLSVSLDNFLNLEGKTECFPKDIKEEILKNYF